MKRKYLDEESLNEITSCQQCKQHSARPALILPCGETVCKQCVQNKLGEDYETTIRPYETFECPVCNEMHEMPRNGLIVSKRLSKLIALEAKEIFRGETIEQLDKCLDDLIEQQSHLANVIENKSNAIRNHYERLRQEVFTNTQIQIDQLNKASEQLVQEINEKEKSDLKSLVESKPCDDKMACLNKLSEKFKKLREKFENALDKNSNPTDSQMADLLKQAKELSSTFIDRTLECTFLNGKKLKLVKSNEIISKRFIGILEAEDIKLSGKNIKPNSILKEITGHTDEVYALTVLSNGILASASGDETIKLWDVSTGKCLRTITGHTNRICALVVLSDDTLVSGSWDKTIKLWNTFTGQCLRTLTGHTESVQTLAVLSDGTLVSGSSDKTIKFWNTSTGKCIRSLLGHNSCFNTLAVLTNDTLAYGTKENKVWLWNSK